MHANPKQGQVSIPYRLPYTQTWVNFHPTPTSKKRFQPNERDTLLIYYAFIINVLH